MELNMELPPKECDLSTLRSYVYRLAERLNVVLSNIDEGNMTYSAGAVLSSAKATASGVSNLKQSIIRSASMIEHIGEKLEKTLTDEYVAKSDIGTYTSKAVADYEIDGKGIEQYFSLIESVSEEVRNLCGYIKSGILDDETVGIEIGSFGGDEHSPFKVRLCDNRLSFYDGDAEVAYLSDSTLHITRAEVKGSLSVGDYEIDLSDGVAWRWRG